MKRTHTRRIASLLVGITTSAPLLAAGCTTNRALTDELTVRDAIQRYTAASAAQLQSTRSVQPWRHAEAGLAGWYGITGATESVTGRTESDPTFSYFTLGLAPQEQTASPETRPTASALSDRPEAPEGYWRKDLWHQMGHEALALGKRDFWRGFKTSFWDLENALVLTAAMGASIAIRETGVDGTVRSRVRGHRQLGDMDETIQILGYPGTHFAGTGVLWLTSTLTRDVKQHEVAKALTQALAVNGVTTLALKAATNTRGPDNDRYAWPSGHTSSAFTVAAVLSEYYGPWVGVPSLALAGLVGYQRIDSRTHDLSDVVFGAMLGYVVGTSIARDEKAQFPELFGMTVVPFADPQTGATGFALMKSW
ncbi:MAG: phosphatase PAP2 family protein [Phycisphaerae bacterium]